jgi:hypothetical protein
VAPVMQHGHTLINSMANPGFDSDVNAVPEPDIGPSIYAVPRRSRARKNLSAVQTSGAHSIRWLIRMDWKAKS